MAISKGYYSANHCLEIATASSKSRNDRVRRAAHISSFSVPFMSLGRRFFEQIVNILLQNEKKEKNAKKSENANGKV